LLNVAAVKKGLETRCPFHQHFTRAFFLPKFLCQKIAKPNIIREKLLNSLSY